MKLTEAEVRHVAELANLGLRDDEIHKMQQDLDGILAHIDKLNEIDTTGVEPMAQVLFDSGEINLRADEERETLGTATAVANAPLTSAGYFKVPKVIER